MADLQNPLSEQDFEDIRVRLKDLDDADALIRKSELAGLDVTEQKARAKDLREQLMKIKQAFFPNKR